MLTEKYETVLQRQIAALHRGVLHEHHLRAAGQTELADKVHQDNEYLANALILHPTLGSVLGGMPADFYESPEVCNRWWESFHAGCEGTFNPDPSKIAENVWRELGAAK